MRWGASVHLTVFVLFSDMKYLWTVQLNVGISELDEALGKEYRGWWSLCVRMYDMLFVPVGRVGLYIAQTCLVSPRPCRDMPSRPLAPFTFDIGIL